MHLPQRGCDAGVREPSQQARLRGFARDRPQGLDQQDFDKAGKDKVAADIVACSLFPDETHQLGQPRDTSDMDHARQ